MTQIRDDWEQHFREFSSGPAACSLTAFREFLQSMLVPPAEIPVVPLGMDLVQHLRKAAVDRMALAENKQVITVRTPAELKEQLESLCEKGQPLAGLSLNRACLLALALLVEIGSAAAAAEAQAKSESVASTS